MIILKFDIEFGKVKQEVFWGENLQDFSSTKNNEAIDPILDNVELKHALTKMKNNFTN